MNKKYRKKGKKMKARRVFVTCMLVSVVLSLLVGVSGATWCDTDFDKRINVSVNNTGGSALTDYQVYINLTANSINETSLRVYNATSCALRPHWCENETSGNCYALWVNYSAVAGSGWTNNTAVYYDNAAVNDASNGATTFMFFDDFDEDITINETYLTNWTKSGSNPLQDKACQNWITSVYSNYNNEDKIYLFEHRVTSDNNISCSSLTRANASAPVNWTDHGIVYTGTVNEYYIEPHGIIFETQSMSDAREGVGAGLGTPKWRLYYCHRPSGTAVQLSDISFLYAPESDLTDWTRYSGNPVRSHTTVGVADPKVCIYNNKVWMHIAEYYGNHYFSYSTDGISSWTNATRNWATERTVVGTLVPFSTGILLTGNPSPYTTYAAHFTTDGDDKGTYSSNPILSGGGTGVWDEKFAWATIVIDKNGSTNISGTGTYYMYYIGYTGSTYKLGLATSTTLTEENETSDLDVSKWQSGGTPTISSGELLINAHSEYVRSINTFQYKAMKARVKYPATADSYHYFGFQSSPSAGGLNTEAFFSYVTPDLKTISGDAAATEATSIYNSAYFGSYHNYEILWKSGEATFYVDETLKDTDTTNVCTIANPVGFYDHQAISDLYVDWTLVRKYASPEPSLVLGSEESQPESTPVISNVVNGSISSTSQYINWTVNQTAHNRVLYSNESDLTPAYYSSWNNSTAAPNITLSALTANTQYWYQAWSYNGTNDSLSDNSSTLSFTTQFGAPIITLLSQYPSLLYQNSTGYFNVSYMISHNSTGLNNSSLSFVYTNYDTDDANYNWSLRVPANNRSEICSNMNDEKILRADNRNNSLNFENNDTITGGNVYEWAGGDENNSRMSIVPVNSTHTLIHWNGTITDTVSMSMWYLDRTSQQTATMTTFDIYKGNRACFKIWDIEAIERHTNYLMSAYLDTHLSGASPNKPNLVYYCNDSYDPEGVINPEDSTNCFYVMSHNATTWVDYKYSVQNSTYIELFTINQSTVNVSVLTTNKAYICFNTGEASSKPYSVNITNSTSTTNITFGETNTTWIGDDTPLVENYYTTNAFYSENHAGHQHQMKLFAADNNGVWGNSTLKTTDIGFAYYPPTAPATNYFYFESARDYDMNNTYNGTFDVNVLVGSDPDGGETHHNLTLHYGNQTFVAIINDSFYDVNATNGDINISFDSSSYYSSIDNYTLRIVATDDESKTSESWLGVNFSLQSAISTLHIGNAINIKDDWGRDFNSNLSANVTTANASGVWMNFTNAEFTNTSLGWLNVTLDEWVNESHNVNSPVTNVSVSVFLNCSGATNDSDIFYYEVTKRTNTATMDSSATQNANTSETFYINATCNEEYSDTFYGAANLLEDGDIVATDSSVTDYVNFSHSESSAGVYNYTIRFYNLTHHDNTTTPTYSNVTVSDGEYPPGTPQNLQNVTGNFWVNHTWNTGGGNVTNSYNVSVNLTWHNGTTNHYYNNTPLSAHKWSNVSVWAYNTSGSGTLSASSISQNTQIPNNVPVLSGLPDNTTTEDVNQIDIFDLDDYFTDADSDTPTYQVESNNQSGNVSVTINTSNNVSYTLASGWNGTASVVINVTDGWGGEDNDTFLIIVNVPPGPGDYIPGNPTTLGNTTGNYWVNYTWNVGGGNVTDSYNVSWNLTWYNTTLVPYMNDTVGEFGWANISVWAYNSSGNGSLSVGSVSSDTQAGGGVFATTMTTGVYNLITYYGSANSSAEQFGDDIGNTDYVAMYNGSFYTHTMGFSANNFTTIHGIGYYVYLNASGSSTYQRNNISDSPYNTQLYNRWNTIGWTNATDTNAEGVATSIGSSCDYTSSLNADGVTYTTHTVGFASNNHVVAKGKGYWVWVNSGGSWSRGS